MAEYFLKKSCTTNQNKMKKILNVYLVALLSIQIFVNCGGSESKSELQKVINLSQRATPLTNKEISGTYRGSYVDDLYNSAAIVQINPNGTFIARKFLFGEEMTDKGLSPMTGKYLIRYEVEENKNAYGQVTSINHIHGIDFNAETQWGIKTSTYIISNEFKLIPLGMSFIDEKAILAKN